MSDEILDFTSNFKKDAKTKSFIGLSKSNIDKENVNVNSMKTRIEYVDRDLVKKIAPNNDNLLQQQSEEINRLKQVSHILS